MPARKMSFSHKALTPEKTDISFKPKSGNTPARSNGAHHAMGNKINNDRFKRRIIEL
jgi:hypothetical protein